MSNEYDELDYMYHDYDDYVINTTETPEPANPISYTTYLKTALLICNIIGGLTDVLLILLIKTQKKSRTRTLLLHMCTNDALLLLRTKLLLEYILQPFKPIECFLEHLDGLLLTAYLLFVIAIQLNSTKWTVAIIYTLVGSFASLRITLCAVYTENKYLGLVVVIVMLSLAINTIVKDVMICCRRNSASIGQEETVRINVARIVVYMILSTAGAMAFSHLLLGEEHAHAVNKILHMLLGIRPVFLLLYLVLAQKDLKMYVVNSFKRSENRYDWLASVRLPDGKNDDPAVAFNMNVTGDTTPTLASKINDDDEVMPDVTVNLNGDEVSNKINSPK